MLNLRFVDESPRWLTVNSRFDEAIRILQKAQRWNASYLPTENELRDILVHIEQVTHI